VALAAAPWAAFAVVPVVALGAVALAAPSVVSWAASWVVCEAESEAESEAVFVVESLVALGLGYEQGAEPERSGLVVGLCIAALVASGRAAFV